jgi:hypothetical protein
MFAIISHCRSYPVRLRFGSQFRMRLGFGSGHKKESRAVMCLRRDGSVAVGG